jgi:glycosyltransferase involved in cell wall biosynthesis
LPLKLFESWISGIPFVSGDVGDRRKILGNPPAGLLARPGDANDLAEKIERIITNQLYKNGLIRNGVKESNKYTWDRLALKITSIYSEY